MKAKSILVIFTLFWTVSGQAVQYYVSPAGVDGSSGSEQDPFQSIQRAADLAKPGDVVHVGEGLYRETVRIRRSGRKDAPIRFVSSEESPALISGVEDLSTPWLLREGKVYSTRVEQRVDQLLFDQLYRLSPSVNEQKNLAENPEYSAKLEHMKALMSKAVNEMPGNFGEF